MWIILICIIRKGYRIKLSIGKGYRIRLSIRKGYYIQNRIICQKRIQNNIFYGIHFVKMIGHGNINFD